MDDAFSFRLEILKKELEFIDNAIRKIDDIGNTIKNWAILAWIGTIAAILGKPELHHYAIFTAAPPLIFMLVDAHWRRNQRRFIFRQYKIAKFLNSETFDRCWRERKLDFELLDPIARLDNKDVEFKKFISLSRILRFQTVWIIYIGLAGLSILLSIIIYFFQ